MRDQLVIKMMLVMLRTRSFSPLQASPQSSSSKNDKESKRLSTNNNNNDCSPPSKV